MLWASLGLATFTLLPLVSRLPWWAGPVAGLAFLALQMAVGHRVLRGLLRLKREGAELRIEEERPYAVALGPELAVTTGLARDLPDHVPALMEELRRANAGPVGEILPRALALPCLLRAFHSVADQYSRLRGGSGPVKLLGDFFLLLAGLLEAPARAVRFRYGRSQHPEALLHLLEALGRHSAFPAWMEALGPLAPLSLVEVRAQASAAVAMGSPGPVPLDVPGSPHPPLVVRLGGPRPPGPGWGPRLPWMGLVLGLVIAVLPGGYLAAPVLLLALGLLLRSALELPLGKAREGRIAAVVAAMGPARLEGRLGPAPEGRACPPGTWLHDDSGSLLLEGLPPGLEGEVAVTGWVRRGPPALLVGELWRDGRRQRLFPLVRRLLVAFELLAVGGAWLVLQAVNL